MTAETVSGRLIPRYRGEPAVHDVRFWGSGGDVIAQCSPCGWRTTLEGGRYTAADLARLARMHEGTEDP